MTIRVNPTVARPGQRRLIVAVILIGLATVGSWWWLTRPSRAELEQVVYDAYARHNYVQAEKSLLRISPRDADVLRLLADVALRTERHGDCIHWLEQLANQSNQPSQELLVVGARAFEFGLPREAERIYLRVLKVDPQSIKPYSQLARLYLAWQRGGDLRRTIAQADSADAPLDEDPMLLWLWIVSDRVRWLEGESQQWLELACQMQPDDPYAAAALARGRLAADQIDQARAIVESSSPAGVPHWPLALARAAADLKSGRLAEAVTVLGPLPDGGEEQPDTWYLRGRAWSACGDVEGASLAYANALQLDPFYVSAHYERGRLLAHGGDEQAERRLREAAQVDELVRRCLQLAQSTRPNIDDLLAVAELGAEFSTRWTQLVCRLAERQDKNIAWPENLVAVKMSSAEKLSVAQPKSFNVELAQRRVVPPSSGSIRGVDAPDFGSRTVRFTETTHELGLPFAYEYGHSPQRWLMETLGGGVAVLDYDADGWPDLFFAQGGPLSLTTDATSPPGKLFRNEWGESLRDVTDTAQLAVAKYSHGCAVGDVNGDGFADLLVCHYGGLTLFINHGDGTWFDATESAGLIDDHWNTSAVFVDLDRDGDLDLYVARYCHAPLTMELRTCRAGDRFEPCRPNVYPAEPDALFENLGDGRFADRSAVAGVSAEGGYGLGVIAADFDNDGAPEVFIGNDTTHNFLWQSSASTGGTLELVERSLPAGVAVDGAGQAEASMGIACGDVDGDERLDLFVTTFVDETCTFFQNLGGLQFEDRTQSVGLSNAGQRLMGWGCQFIDADNDGWLDLAIVNGHLHDRPQHPQFYRNDRGRFVEQSSQVGAYFSEPKLGRSMATWDYNRDGRVDLVVSHQSEPASVLRNDSVGGRSLTVCLIGTQSPRDATGAIVRARLGDRWIVRLVSTQGGYLSACSADVVLGLGEASRVEELEVRWPSGLRQHFTKLIAGLRVIIREGETNLVTLP